MTITSSKGISNILRSLSPNIVGISIYVNNLNRLIAGDFISVFRARRGGVFAVIYGKRDFAELALTMGDTLDDRGA